MRNTGLLIAVLLGGLLPARAGHPTNSPLPSADPENVRGFGDVWALAGFSFFGEGVAKSQAIRNAKAQCPYFFRGWGIPDPGLEPVILWSGCQAVGASGLGRDCSATAKVRCIKGDQPPPDDMAVIPLKELGAEYAGLSFEAESTSRRSSSDQYPGVRNARMTQGEGECFDKQLAEFVAWAQKPREVGNTAVEWLRENGIKKIVIDVQDLSIAGEGAGKIKVYGAHLPVVSWSNDYYSARETLELKPVTLDRSRKDAECRVVDEDILERWRLGYPFSAKGGPSQRFWRSTAGREVP